MSRAVEVLKEEKQRLLHQIAELKKGVRDIDTALNAIGEVDATSIPRNVTHGRSAINDGIIEAIRNECGAPASIYEFLSRRGIDTSKHSISTRLSKMKNEGVVAHDGFKWIMPQHTKGSDAETSEPFEKPGPVGRDKGFPPDHPEGSNPSGSTVAQIPYDDWDDTVPSRHLDDEIPF